MNFYRRWGRYYVHLSFGVLSEGDAAAEDEIAEHFASLVTAPDEYAADGPHPFQDAEALQGNIITPAGAQSGAVIREDSPATYNPVNQRDQE